MTSLVLVAVTVVALLGVALAFAGWLRRQRISRGPDVVRARIDEYAALKAPEELPRAPEVTKAMRRRFTSRTHPIRHRKSGRPF